MSLGSPLTLRPVDWSDVDAQGHNKRRKRSSDDEEQSLADQLLGLSPKKRKRALGLPAVYYPPSLSPSEKLWRERYSFLHSKGYQLRPRYQPGWSPTRYGNGRYHHSGEDYIMQILPQVLDAIRRQDGLVVCVKMIQDPKKVKEIQILRYFSSGHMEGNPRNHVVPFYDTFADSFSPHLQYMVMPVLRRFDDPDFLMVGEVVDFVSQVLEGLTFLHENNIAHHNLNADHIMMDAKSIIPTGWHFVSHFCEPDGMTRITPLDRKNHSVRYYFVGFGSCYHISPKQMPLVVDIGGTDTDIPELSTSKPYDPFKLDIYTLGNIFYKEIYLRYQNLEFLSDLIDYMRVFDFQQRPNSDKVLRVWYQTRDALDEEAIEERPLRFREGVRPRYIYDPDAESPSPVTTRSYKRDISSIINKN